ncbi:MAG: hypothetical protein KBD37_05870 [Burkholderiales bacterium]|nr:hypothetical protein [Burkholderiales bacterium]
MDEAYEALEAHNCSETELLNYDRMEMINMDMRAREAYAEDRGEARGEARGIKIGAINIAQAMQKSGELDEKIALYTGLSLSEIAELEEYMRGSNNQSYPVK